MEEQDTYEIKYLVMPAFVFNNDKLSFLAAKIYSFIHNYRSHTGQFFFSNEKLAEIFNCHEMSISKAISQLVKEKYIETEQPNGGKRYIVDLWGGKPNGLGGVSQNAYPSSHEGSAKTLTLNEAKLATPSKNNIIRISNKENLETNPLQERRDNREKAAQRKGRRLGMASALLNKPYYEKPQTMYVKKGGTHAEDIV